MGKRRRRARKSKRKGRATRRVKRRVAGPVRRVITKLAKQVRSMKKQVNPPSHVEYDNWSTGIISNTENSRSWKTFMISAATDLVTAKAKMLYDADGSGVGTGSATGSWGRGAWVRMDQLMVTTFRNNYKIPVNLEIVPFKRSKNVNKEFLISGPNLYPLYVLEKCFNNITQDTTENMFGGLSFLDTTASCDIQNDIGKCLTPRWQRDMAYWFGRKRTVWLQPGQTLTLSRKNVVYQKYTVHGQEDAFNACGYLVGTAGPIGHDTGATPTSVGVMAAQVDYCNKIFNKIKYRTAVYSAYEDYYPDETVLGTTLEVVLPDDPAVEALPN